MLGGRLELPRLAAYVPQTYVYANFTTRAMLMNLRWLFYTTLELSQERGIQAESGGTIRFVKKTAGAC